MLRGFFNSACIVLIALLISSTAANAAPDGKALFMSNCAACHNPIKDATGPALQNVDKHAHGKEWIYKWVHNPPAIIASGDPHAKELQAKYVAVMTAFPALSNEEIDAILKYADDYKAPVAAAPAAGGEQVQETGSWVYTLITLALLVLVLILWKANNSLRRIANESVGVPNERPIPIYRSKLFIACVAILAFIMAGYWMVNGAVNMGRQQNYQPLQPIYYSHKVHAGINQVNCLYCHAGAEKSRHAMIPSTNVCMNCHKQINEYSGVKDHPLYTAEGVKIDGTKQIQELYRYAGWDPAKKDYNRDEKGNIKATPIQWVKIHNLPDHVYFNHSQHVKVGQIQCQRCHGPIQEMDEVYQFAPLSMGWCINCHRQTQVKFTENNYYSIFEKYHQEIKDGTRKGVTVEEIGGLECQRCHY